MNSNKGVTLTSLIIYVIGMLIVVASISTLTTFFYKNIDTSAISDDSTTQYTKFLSTFSEEINNPNNIVLDCKTYEENGNKISYIIFSSGNQYTFMAENNSIYRNQVKLCQNIDICEFSYKFQDSKYIVNVEFKSGKLDKTGKNIMTYTIKSGK